MCPCACGATAARPRARLRSQLFYSYFKTLVGKEIIVELKNDLAIRGTLQAVDQYLNIKLRETSVVDEEKFPHMVRGAHTSLGGGAGGAGDLRDGGALHHRRRRETHPPSALTPAAVPRAQIAVKNCFIRGSVVRYVQLPPDGVDTEVLHDATRREARGQ